MKRLSHNRKKFILARARREARKKIRDRQFRLAKIQSNNYLQNLAYHRHNIELEKRYPSSTTIKLAPDQKFAITKNSKNVLAFIFKLKSYAKATYNGYKILIDLSKTKSIDIGAICLLLSVVKELSYNNIAITGTIPEDSKCRDLFIESGYLAHMKTLTGKTFDPPSNKNLILTSGRDKTSNRDVGEAIKEAVQFLTGRSYHYPPIFSIVQEINGNSIEHAYNIKSKEHWPFSVNYDDINNKVIFTFADNGIGILKTLRRKLSQDFLRNYSFMRMKTFFLRGAFTKKYSSRHEYQINRNKGLPLLRKIQSDRQEVKNLFVITNKVFLDIDDYKSIPITKNFSGTFYYWELDLDCIRRWRERTTQI